MNGYTPSDDPSDRRREVPDAEAVRRSPQSPSAVSRRSTITALGAACLLNLSSVTADAGEGDDDDTAEAAGDGDQDAVVIIDDPETVVDSAGAPLDEPGDEVELFDPVPEGPPLVDTPILGKAPGWVLGLYKSVIFPSLGDSRRLIVAPPEEYDPEKGYDEPWTPLTWGDYRAADGSARLFVEDDATTVTLEVEGAVPRGLYTVWVVKFHDGELVGAQPLGSNTGKENEFRTGEDGSARLAVTNDGGPITAGPRFDPHTSARDLPHVAGDLTEEEEIHLASVYHYDDQTWGSMPGPYSVAHLSFVFDFAGEEAE